MNKYLFFNFEKFQSSLQTFLYNYFYFVQNFNFFYQKKLFTIYFNILYLCLYNIYKRPKSIHLS